MVANVNRWTARRVLGAALRRFKVAIAQLRRWARAAMRANQPVRAQSQDDGALNFEMHVRNLLSRRSVLGSGPEVTLTTYGTRSELAYIAIESIGSGSVRPRNIFLWIDDPEVAARPPRSLRRLQKRGLTIALSRNYGPHTKYYPYVEARLEFTEPVVTADDDMVYPVAWLAELAAHSDAHPGWIHSHRAHRIEFDGDTIKPYVNWTQCFSTEPSLLHFQTGVSGVIYPPEFLRHVRAQGEAFRELCPRADDVWLHKCAVDLDMPVQQITNSPQHYAFVPGSQETTLMADNVQGGANDAQIAVTYSAEQLASLARLASHRTLDGADTQPS